MITDMNSLSLELLRKRIRGNVLYRGNAQYDKARQVFNGAIDKRPLLIIQCRGITDITESIAYARENGLLVAIHSSGHNVAGTSMCDDGLVIDLRLMKGIRVDPINSTVYAEPGITWGELDRETQMHGLATTGGTVTSTGIAGLTLGGGFGWLHGKYGLTCDNLISADIVTANGELLVVSEEAHQGLFWAIRGGGGNFGVVTSFKYRLHPVGKVLAGTRIYSFDMAMEVLKCYREVSQESADELTVFASLFTTSDGPVVSVDLCYCGTDLSAGEKLLSPLQLLGTPISDQVRVMPYLKLQSMFDNPFRRGQHSYWKSTYLTSLSVDAIDVMINNFQAAPSPQTIVFIEHFHGAMCRVSDWATAFSHRQAQYSVLIASNWINPENTERNRIWTQRFFQDLGAFSTDRVYVNYLGEEPLERVEKAYGSEKYKELARIKAKYDATNFFRVNQNILPLIPQ